MRPKQLSQDVEPMSPAQLLTMRQSKGKRGRFARRSIKHTAGESSECALGLAAHVFEVAADGIQTLFPGHQQSGAGVRRRTGGGSEVRM